MKTKAIEQMFDKLGREGEDKVTGFAGVIVSVSFDVYGCIQFLLVPPVDKKKMTFNPDSGWMDARRIKIVSKARKMLLPDFEQGYIAEGRCGPAVKPSKR